MDPAALASQLAILKFNLGFIAAEAAVCTLLLGIVTAQVYSYVSVEYKDRIFLKSVVAIVLTTDILLVTFLWIYAFHPFVVDYGAPNLDSMHWTLRAIVSCSSIIQCFTQAFYAYRVHILSKRLFLPLLFWIGIVIRFWFFNSAVILSRNSTSLHEYLTKFFWLFVVSISVGMFLDFATTAALSYYLFRRGMAFPRTRRIVMGLMLRSIEVGIPTCACAVSLLVMLVLRRPQLIGVLLMLMGIYPQLYCLSLMISLNGRRALREASNVATMSHDYTSHVWASSTTNVHGELKSKISQPRVNPEVSVTRTVEIELSAVASAQQKNNVGSLEKDERGFLDGRDYSYAV